MTDFERCLKIGTEMGDTRFCAVLAVTVACYQDFDFVHKMFEESGRQFRRGTPNTITYKVLKALGRKTKDVTKHYRSRTVTALRREVTSRDVLLVWVRGHILCVRDGDILDWTKNRRHRIRKIERVLWS